MTGDIHDNEKMEEQLRRYFRAEVEGMAPSGNTWDRISARLGEQEQPRLRLGFGNFWAFGAQRTVMAAVSILFVASATFFWFRTATPDPAPMLLSASGEQIGYDETATGNSGASKVNGSAAFLAPANGDIVFDAAAEGPPGEQGSQGAPAPKEAADSAWQSVSPESLGETSTGSFGATNSESASRVLTDGDYLPREPYDTTFFQNYGVNPFVDTVEDKFSTFAMDVDTASYSVARRFVTDGNLPNPDSVRVEEFVNYFDQGYAAPTDEAFAIYMDGAPSPFGDDGQLLLRVGLQGREISTADRKDATLIFVIDVSGSMSRENRLGLVKRSLGILVEELRPTDEVGIVVYGSQGRVVLQLTPGNEYGTILDAIDSLTSEGSTNAEHGLSLGYDMALESLAPDRITRVVLLSDGVANVGRTGPESILESVRDHATEGVTLSTIGVGMGNYNDVLMEQLADQGDGNYAYVDTLAEAQRVFSENLTGMLQVIARDAKVQVEFNPEIVHSYRLLGYENRPIADEDFRNDAVDAGEVGAGHSVTALYEVELVDGADGHIATTFIRYEDEETGEVVELRRDVSSSDVAAAFTDTAPRFQLSAVVAGFAEVLRHSEWAADGGLAEVRSIAEQVEELLSGDADVAEFLELVRRAAQIETFID